MKPIFKTPQGKTFIDGKTTNILRDNNYQEGGGRGAEKREGGGALPKIAAKIGGLKSTITHLTEGGGGGLNFYSKCK